VTHALPGDFFCDPLQRLSADAASKPMNRRRRLIRDQDAIRMLVKHVMHHRPLRHTSHIADPARWIMSLWRISEVGEAVIRLNLTALLAGMVLPMHRELAVHHALSPIIRANAGFPKFRGRRCWPVSLNIRINDGDT
jgi:hypothetical protein